LSDHEFVQVSHFDGEPIKFSQEYVDFLKQECPEISDRLAQHVARLFTRDPVPMYEGELKED